MLEYDGVQWTEPRLGKEKVRRGVGRGDVLVGPYVVRNNPHAAKCSFQAPPKKRPRSKIDCRAYLVAHPKYWGSPGPTYFAQHVRLQAIGYASHPDYDRSYPNLTRAAFELVDDSNDWFWQQINHEMDRWSKVQRNGCWWTVGWEGRSSGYLVLHPTSGVHVFSSVEYEDWEWSEIRWFAQVVYDFDMLCVGLVNLFHQAVQDRVSGKGPEVLFNPTSDKEV